jgi:thiamine biosynthesis lipoprotein
MDTILSPKRRAVLKVLGAATLAAAGCSRTDERTAGFRFGGPTMGTSFTATLAAQDLSAAGRAAPREAVRLALDTVERRMSTYRPDSELSRLNRHPIDAPVVLSPDAFAVFALAQDVGRRTDGVFDVTVGPVVDAWGFGPSRQHRVPPPKELAALGRRVGSHLLALDPRAGTIRKARPDVSADLSGVAKGFAVDQAALALEALGFGDYLVEAGGEVRTRGRNPVGEPWRVGIERPDAVPSVVDYVVPLSGLAMATSGDYRIYFEEAGRRYSHEIDPRTGAPIAHALASVSVVAADCGFADAMSTALIVLGAERGYALAAAQGIAAHFILRTPDGGFQARSTPAFAALGGHPAKA